MKIDLEQIGFLKHSIGFRNDRVKGRTYRKYIAFRNYYYTSENFENLNSLNQLVDLGLMIRRIDNLSNGYIFRVTGEGIEFLEELLEVKIIEED